MIFQIPFLNAGKMEDQGVSEIIPLEIGDFFIMI